MLALPAAAPPAPKRQVLVATAMFAAAGVMLLGGLSALWFRFRNNAGGAWLPEKVIIPEVATNVMWITALLACVMIQWAVYSAKRNDRPHTAMALGVTFVLGLAMLNSQAYVWRKVELPVKGETAYNPMFYAFTGTVFALIVVGLAFTVVGAFRVLGGRTRDRETLSGLALYWYFLAVAVSTVWFVVYVTK